MVLTGQYGCAGHTCQRMLLDTGVPDFLARIRVYRVYHRGRVAKISYSRVLGVPPGDGRSEDEPPPD